MTKKNDPGLYGEIDNEPDNNDLLKRLISDMYSPDGDETNLDLISHADLTDSIREVAPRTHRAALYDIMIEMNFIRKTIEGTVYWLVYSI